MSIEVFYSYSHKDEELRDELQKQLSSLKRQKVITAWYDRDISAGIPWEEELLSHLNSAQVILLLISPDFMASDYCWDKEMTRAMERHKTGEARVIPVILRPTADWNEAPFGILQAFPTNGKPVTTWTNRDEAFENVAKAIRKAVQEVVAKQSPTSTATPSDPPPMVNLPQAERNSRERQNLEHSDLTRLAELLENSGRAASNERQGLCRQIGVSPNNVYFIDSSSAKSFALQLVFYLKDITNNKALLQLCDAIAPTFEDTKYANTLVDIRNKISVC